MYGDLPYDWGVKKQELSGRLEARLRMEVLARLKRAADIQGRTLTDFVVGAADEAACRIIEQADVIRLSLEDQRQIADAIAEAPELSPALRRAFERRRELLRSK